VLFLVGQDMVFILTSLFVGLLSMFLVEESFSCAQFSFGGGCLLPCSHTVNLALTMFLVHATWYSKLLNFFCVEWTICTQQKSLIVSSIPDILAIQRKAKEFGNPAKGWDSKLTCSQLITGLVKI